MADAPFTDGLAVKTPNLPVQITSRFKLLERIGRFEEKYLLKEKSTDDYYVLKRMSTDGDECTVNEAELLRGMKHRGLPEFEPEIKTSGGIYILRRFIDGIPLDEYLRDNLHIVNRELAVDTALQLCGILTYLHSRAVIHRDISPSNIILDPSGGGVFLIDFGIAREYSDDAESDTIYGGKKDFMAPEQYGSMPMDGRADIYALGKVLALWLTGTADKKLEHIISKCTAFSPADRYKNADALAKALKRYKYKTNRKFATASAAVLAACILLSAGFAVGRYTDTLRPAADNGYIIFKEPLIEQAARCALGLSDSRPLTAADIETVSGLYIFGEQFAPTRQAFYDLTHAYLTENEHRFPPMGSIESLEDLRLFSNLTDLFIACHPFSDITPLKYCARLSTVDINNCEVSDVSALSLLPKLSQLNLVDALIDDFSFFQKMERLDHLTVSGTPLRSFSELGDTSHLLYLDVEGSLLESLDGIAAVEGVTELNIAHTNVRDFTALNDGLPYLERLRISSDMERYLDTFKNEDVQVLVY